MAIESFSRRLHKKGRARSILGWESGTFIAVTRLRQMRSHSEHP
jgi:hypothetical protein